MAQGGAMTVSTVSKAAEKLLGLISKHPGLSTAEIASALRLRRQTRQRAMRLLMESGRIFGTLGTDRKTLEWRPREPHRAEPVSEPRHEPAGEAVTVIAPAAAVAGKSKSPHLWTDEDWRAVEGDDDLLIGSPS